MLLSFKISLGANIGLLGLVAILAWPKPPAAPHSVALPAPPASSWIGTTTGSPPKMRPLDPTPYKFTPAVLAQFAQMGISRDIVIDALLEDFDRRSTRGLVAMQKKYAPKQVPDREMLEFSRQNEVERIRELKETLGEDAYLAWDKEQTLRELNRARAPGDELAMAAEEAEQAYRLQKEFDEKNRELTEVMQDGVADQADIGKLQAQAQETLDRSLEKLLGRERFSQLRGNADPTSEVYRTFGDLAPTPGQAKAVVQAEAEYRDREAALVPRIGENPAEAAALSAELKAANDEREDRLRRIFGAEAYDNMKQQSDPTYKMLRQYAGAWELKDQEVQSVYKTLHSLDRETERIRTAAQMSETAGHPVNWHEIESTIERTRQQAEGDLQNLIGGERLRRLKQNGLLTIR